MFKGENKVEKYYLPELETDRLILRAVQREDALDMFEYASDLQTTQYVLFDRHLDLAMTKEIIEEVFLKRPEKNMPTSYALVLKNSNKMIGTCDFFPSHYDNYEMGFILNKAYWRQNYMYEAAEKILEYAFNEYGVRRMEIRHVASNVASAALIKKLGFILEGVKKSQVILEDGSISDIYEYRLLKEEFDERVSQKV